MEVDLFRKYLENFRESDRHYGGNEESSDWDDTYVVYIFSDFYLYGDYMYDDRIYGYHIDGRKVHFTYSPSTFLIRNNDIDKEWDPMDGSLKDHLYYYFVGEFCWKLPELDFRRAYKWGQFVQLTVNFDQGDINFIY